jgi:hypothetical protein
MFGGVAGEAEALGVFEAGNLYGQGFSHVPVSPVSGEVITWSTLFLKEKPVIAYICMLTM